MGRGSFALQQRGQVRDAPFAVGIREQAIMQVVKVQDGELMDGSRPAACQQEKGGS